MTASTALQLGRILIVGGGRMGQAICAGMLRLEGMTPSQITVANPGADKRTHIEKTYGVATVSDARAGLPADTIVLAVKPGIAPEVAHSLAESGIGEARVISIAAGVSTATLAVAFGSNTQIVRVMPNTPLLSGCGMSALSGGASATPETIELVRALFSHMGDAVVIDESKQDIACALSGSGPAYFELVVETFARAGEGLGLDYATSLELALHTMRGTAVMLEETHQDLPAAIDAVSSPGGTTIAALDAMRADGVEEALTEGIRAAARRSEELGAAQ